jgi:hypothetical protein
MIFPSDIKYKRHDCYCEHEFESYERERDGSYGWSFSIPELDEKLKVKAAKDKVRFSDVTIATLEGYLK